MTTRPRPVPLDRSLLPGLAAVALFAVLAAVVLAADTSVLVESWGFGGGNVVATIGAALIGIEGDIPVESFVVALLVIAVALDAALDGSLMLAKRDEEPVGGDPVTDGGASVTDGSASVTDGSASVTDGSASVTDGSASVTDGSASVTDGSASEAGGTRESADSDERGDR